MSDIANRLRLVRAGFDAGALRTNAARRQQLEALKNMLETHTDEFTAALHDDLGKSDTEAWITEIGFLINEIDHTLKHLGDWTKPRKVSLPIHLQPGSAKVYADPLGTVLIIAPWNYPLQLALAPLIPALAAGNTAIVKPSEIAPATAAIIDRLLPRFLDAAVCQVVLGGVEETTALLNERFDHIFYTGNGKVGRIVMQAAAQHLTPVTLELGGKSPTFVTESANLEVAARRIAWGKYTNAGQTCVAPDYLLVDEQIASQFLQALKSEIVSLWSNDPRQSNDYGRIINQSHFNRLAALLDKTGGEPIIGGDRDRDQRYIAPTVITGIDGDDALMEDEIFGPVLPVVTYSTLPEALDFVNQRDKPLALYVFSEDDQMTDFILERTTSGGVSVNHTLLHLAVPELPFGGVGPSGMGAYHGKVGFDTFSHQKSVLKRRTWPDPALAYPPFTGTKQKILKLFM